MRKVCLAQDESPGVLLDSYNGGAQVLIRGFEFWVGPDYVGSEISRSEMCLFRAYSFKPSKPEF